MLKKMKSLIHFVIRKVREKIVLLQVASHKNEISVGGYTRLSRNTHLGKNPNFNGLVVNGIGKVVIGDNFHSGTGCLIITSIHNYDFGKKIPYDETHIEKPVTIMDNVWLGDKVTILGKVTIGEGAIVQAGAVVIKDVEAGAIVGGNPAKIFKYRDMDHYYKLKNEKMFH
jgi:acetyltransferase-like isoleucine patch superfamily enzyme